MSTGSDGFAVLKSTVVALVVTAVILVWAWPRGGWHNEWSNGQCLAWRITEYGGGLFTRVDHGPHVVADRWC